MISVGHAAKDGRADPGMFMMSTKTKPSFLRLFIGGFAFGAVAMVSVAAVQADDAMIPAAHAATVAHR